MKTRTPILLALLILLGAAALWLTVRDAPPSVPSGIAEDDLMPPGRWHVSPDIAHEEAPVEDMARVLSLPYTSGSQPAPGQVGVVAHDVERTEPGVNLYVSGHAPEAILMDSTGRPLHRWRYPFERAFPGRRPTVETAFFRRAQLLPDGDLLALYQGGGLIRLGPRSELRWGVPLGLYNDFFVTPDGRIATIGKAAQPIPGSEPPRYYLEDFVQWLDLDGRITTQTSLLGAFQRSDFAPLLQPLGDEGDILHSNTVFVFDGALADRSPTLFAAGNLLVSLREVDLIGILDPTGERVLWAQKGPWDAQHEPVPLENGRILLFDNRGVDGKSRVLEVDPATGAIEWEYRGPDARPLWSKEGGSVARLPNGNTLITESERGRAIEIEPGGGIVWEFASPHRARNDQLIATLFEVIRLPADAASFLADDS